MTRLIILRIDPASVQRISEAITRYQNPELVLEVDADELVGAGPLPASTKMTIQEAEPEWSRP